MRASETQRKTWELQTVQECHRSQQRVHKQHQIKPQQYVLFYSGNTPVGKAICRVNRALLYTLMYQRAGYADRTVNFPAFCLCLMFSCKLRNTMYNIKNQGVTHLWKKLTQTKQQHWFGTTVGELLYTLSGQCWMGVKWWLVSVFVISRGEGRWTMSWNQHQIQKKCANHLHTYVLSWSCCETWAIASC